MRIRALRPLTSFLVTAVWLVAGTRPAAVAWHVASGHGHDAHGAAVPAAPERTGLPLVSAAHAEHAHGLVETLPGVRNDPRISLGASPLPVAHLPAFPDAGSRSGLRRALDAAPGVPPPEAPPVLRL